MCRVVNYHSSWFGQQQVELLMHLVFRVWCKDERVSQVIPLAVALTQLEVPQEVDRVSQLCILAICTGITTGGMSRMPPRRRGRGRGKFQESEGQNEDRRSIPLRAVGQCAWRSHRICLSVGISSWKYISSSSRNQLEQQYFVRIQSLRFCRKQQQCRRGFQSWCISEYPAVASDQQRALRDSEATTFCEQEPAVGFVSVFLSGASGNTALSSPRWYLSTTMRRVVNYHSSWFGQQHVELLMHMVFRVWCKDERVIPVCLYTPVATNLSSQNLLSAVVLCLNSLAPCSVVAFNSCTILHVSRLFRWPWLDLAGGAQERWAKADARFQLLVEIIAMTTDFFGGICIPGFTAGRGFNPAGGAPGGG
ncbi:hypothetical protein F511_18860 [Dorcoceras hygrometricum]|uniref:Uncharacterized protein n=1 Tax=Dorcoceras hygrometricum TaxID=472368 RepID=A0A2Z7A646_9LAMI|nr:hypothetical protein F511_18860 [Dorcoceras hygrometricum]